MYGGDGAGIGRRSQGLEFDPHRLGHAVCFPPEGIRGLEPWPWALRSEFPWLSRFWKLTENAASAGSDRADVRDQICPDGFFEMMGAPFDAYLYLSLLDAAAMAALVGAFLGPLLPTFALSMAIWLLTLPLVARHWMVGGAACPAKPLGQPRIVACWHTPPRIEIHPKRPAIP